MRLERQGDTAATVLYVNGDSYLFSYSTLVAVWTKDGAKFKTSKFHSVTTSKHINKYFDDARAKETGIVEMPQDWFDGVQDTFNVKEPLP